MELQLTHSQEIKAAIDRAWGVMHNKHKKEKGPGTAENSSSGLDRDILEFKPFGLDSKRERYWVVDSACSCFSTSCAVVLPWNTFGYSRRVFPLLFVLSDSPILFRELIMTFSNVRFTACLCIYESLEVKRIVQGRFVNARGVPCRH